MFAVPAIIAYPVGVFGVAVGAAAYLWYRQPAFAVKYLMKLFLYTSGLRPNYVRAGKYIYCYAERGRRTPDKSTILFVHGFSASKDQWVPIVQKLPRDLHIVVIDLPGHGDTTIPDPCDKVKLKNMVEYVHQFVDAIGLNKEPFHLVGTSLGGAIAGCYAADYPSELCKLTVICPALRTPVKTDFLKEVDAGHCRLIPDTADSLKSMLNSCVYHPIKASDQFFEGAIQLRLHKNPFYHRLFYALNNDPEGEEEALAKMSQIEAPTQLIWGKHDQLIHVSGVDLLKERLKHLETSEVYERCGHSVAMDRPGQLVKSLLVFRGEYKPKEQ